MRRAGLALAAALLLACPQPGTRQPSPAPKPRLSVAGNRLNVLLVTIDTLRADHLGVYGYRRATSPSIDALGRRGVVFEQAYTYWPKTRGSFVAMLTGRLAAQSGYGKTHPLLVDFNPTLASVLQEAGYDTVGVVDNPNVASSLGYAKGFARYRETWEEPALATEMDRTRAITADAVSYLAAASPERPFLLWLHYVNPHAPYEPPPPHDTAFLDAGAARGPVLSPVAGFHGGVPRQWERAGRRLGWYVAQYDGEIAAVDAEVGRVLQALDASAVRERTLVLLSSDHGESLGEHDYFFDHGENLFDPSMRVPLLLAGPGIAAGRRSQVLATTLDFVPTLLDALKVSYPPDLAGVSLLGAARDEPVAGRARLPGQNDRNLLGAWGTRFKIVATPAEGGTRYALFDRTTDPGETRDASGTLAEAMRQERRELELFRERIDAQLVRTRRLLEGRSGEERLSAVACENLKAMGYVQQGCE
ncbi:MAG TPA: sulfatase [Vicinamibacteria bacterium]|nr:sulfatase [Vicinamibacteria bacterium]